MDWHLPPLDSTTEAFLKLLLAEKKKALLISQIEPRSAPTWPELNTKKLMARIQQCPKIMEYLPDETC